MGIVRTSYYFDIGVEDFNKKAKECIAWILEGLALDIKCHNWDYADFKLPFDIHFELSQEICDLQIKATLSLEYTQEHLDWLEEQQIKTLEYFRSLDKDG